MNKKLDIVISCYKPDADFVDKLNLISKLCRYLIVCDNTPGSSMLSDVDSNVHIISQFRNLGLSKALNLSLVFLESSNPDFVIFFDQDSFVDRSLINKLILGYFKCVEKSDPRVLIGPFPHDDSEFQPKHISNGFIRRSCIQTSGMLVPYKLLPNEIKFNEKFFLDFIDYDWCWYLTSIGWRVYVDSSILMPHRLGFEKRTFLGMCYHVPAPYRHYFQFRDTLNLLFYCHVPILQKIRYFSILLPKIFIYPFIMDSGLVRLKWMLSGIRDFFKGVDGAGAACDLLCSD